MSRSEFRPTIADLLGAGEPEVEPGARVSNERPGHLLVHGYVLGIEADDEHALVIATPERRRNSWEVRFPKRVPIDELSLVESAGSVAHYRWICAQNLLHAAIDLPRTDVRRWLDYVGWAATLRRAG